MNIRKIATLMILMIWIVVKPSFSKDKLLKTTVAGFLRDNSTLLPIANTEVKVLGLNQLVKTGSNGSFKFTINGKSNSVTLMVSNPLYWEKQVAVQTSKASDIEILLSAKKQRLIVTSDIGGTDPDDEQSMVHLLASSNEIDIEGIVCGLAWLEGKLGVGVTNAIIDAYGKVLPNLKVHDKEYPSATYLKSILKTGQPHPLMSAVGEGKDSPGSELIIKAVDKDDPRPIWLNVWGGANTIAQALWKIKNTRTPDEVNKFVHKIRVYDILGQDDAGAWIAKTFPDLIYIRNKEVYGWGPSDEWVKNNVQSRGALGAKYPNRVWAMEGDSPAFMHLIANGLNDPNKISQGGWGGRFDLTKVSGIRGMDFVAKSGADEPKYDPYWMFTNTSEGGEAINRWKQQIWNDFSAKMLWSVTNAYKKANHQPLACVNGDCTKQIIEIKAKPNSTIKFDANKSIDSDGDKISYKWFYYKEPSTYKGRLSLSNNESGIIGIAIPENAKGKTIHVILEVSDDGKPNLTAYRRIIIHVD